MEAIIIILLCVLSAFVLIMATTILYTLLYEMMPFAVIIMFLAGLWIGFSNAIKNTCCVFKEVYGKR